MSGARMDHASRAVADTESPGRRGHVAADHRHAPQTGLFFFAHHLPQPGRGVVGEGAEGMLEAVAVL